MKEITYIEFPSGWRPPAYRNITIERRKWLCSQASENGNVYSVLSGYVSDEDATYIALADPKARIKEISSN